MVGSKLTQILKTFSPEEFKNFEKFVVSPYFNTGRNAEGLYSILKPHYPDFSSPELDRKLVFRNFYPGEKFNEMKFKNLSTALTRLAEQFMVIERLKAEPIEFEKMLMKDYFYRENYKSFTGTAASLEKKIDKSPFDRLSTFNDKDLITIFKYSYFLKFNLHDKAIPLIGESAEFNTAFFLIKFIKNIIYYHRAQGTYQAGMENDLVNAVRNNIDLDNIMADMREKKYPYLWLLEMYYYSLRFYIDLDDVDSFYKAWDIFNKHKEKYSRYEKHYILEDFYSYCIRRFSRGDKNFVQMEFEICKLMKEENALTEADNVSYDIMRFRNVIYTAQKVKEYKWLEEFINDCSPMLHPDNRESMKNFSLARLEFERGNFEKALEYASTIRYDSFTYKLDVKNLLLLTYYELELFDQAESLIQTYRHYVKHNKDFSRAYMVKFKNFIDIYSGLFKARSTGNTKDIDLF